MKKNVNSRRARSTNSQEDRRSLFPFAVPLRRLRVAPGFSFGIALALLILSLPTATARPNTHRYPAQDFNTLSAAGNNNLKRIWSDGETMWVADNSDSKLYAYDLTTKQRDLDQDFTLTTENASPSGMWSDGVTMWVSDWDDDKLYAYNLATKNRDSAKDFDTLKSAGNTNPTGIWSDGTTIWIADSGVSGKLYAYKMSDKSRDASKDFNTQTLRADGNNFPQGIWSDGTTMWVADYQGREDHEENKIYAYNLKTKSRDAAKDFNTLNAAGNDRARGIWSDGETMWVADQTDNKIYAYRSFAFRNSVQDFDALKAAGNNAPRSLWSDGRTIWVADSVDRKLYAYNLDTKDRDSAKDFDTLKSAGNTNPTGVWSDETTMWVADWDDDKLYAYNLATKSRDSAKDFDTLKSAGNTNPTGIWSDKTTMWVADTADRIYAYKMSDKSRDSTKDFDTNSLIGNRYIQGIWSDGTTLWAANWTGLNKIYAFNLSEKTRDAAKDFDTLNAAGNTKPRGLWSDGTTMWVTDGKDDKIYAYRLSDAASLSEISLTGKIPLSNTESTNMSVSLSPPFDGGGARYTASVPYASTNLTVSPTTLYPNDGVSSILPTDTDATTDGHQVNLGIGDNQISITVTNALTNSLPQTRTYTVNIKREFYTFHNPSKDIALASLATANIYSHWSDGTTMWVSGWEESGESTIGKIYAYKTSDKSRDASKDFNTLTAAENNTPRGIWSDGTTMWVADSDFTITQTDTLANPNIVTYHKVIFAYNLETKSHISTNRFTLKPENGAPRGIWSDGTTMWVADSEDAKLYAYRMSDKKPDPAKDFDTDLLRNAGNTKPAGIWSDGATMWVADSEDAKLYAYKLTRDCSETGKDFNTLRAVGNTKPTGIWSDGTTMWILDSEDKKLYAYNQPLSGNALLESLSLIGINIGTFSSHINRYTASGGYATTSTTLTAVAQDTNAGVLIQPPDANSDKHGHQVNFPKIQNLAEGQTTEITITVVAENGDTEGYVVTINQHPKERDKLQDFHLISTNTPHGIWSNNTNMWVADPVTDRIYAYKMSDKSRDSSKDITLAAGNGNPWGIWSNNTNMWVVDYEGREHRNIYAYNMWTNNLAWDGSRSGTSDFNAAHLDAVDKTETVAEPIGLWSDGTTMWVVDATTDTIYAYKMADKNPDPSKDITLDASKNSDPGGLWSDGTTMWVVDTHNDKIYAYKMADGSRDSSKDFDTLIPAGNLDPIGLWSDGTTMWVSDSVDKKLYAYNLPSSPPVPVAGTSDSDDASLISLRLSGVSLNPVFSSDNSIYTAIVDHTVTSTTVIATPSHSEASVNISPTSSSDGGHRVDLKEGRNFIYIGVTAEDGGTWTYIVAITREAAPPHSGGSLPQSFSPLAVGGNPSALESSSSGGGWMSRLISAEALPGDGVRFVFVVSAEEFGLEASSSLISGEWRLMSSKEAKVLRESGENGLVRLTVILPQAEGKQRFLRLAPQR